MFNGVKADANGVLYYYKDGAIATGLYTSEIVEIDGALYLVKYSGKVAVNETRTIGKAQTNGLLPAGTYEFGADGKLIDNHQNI